MNKRVNIGLLLSTVFFVVVVAAVVSAAPPDITYQGRLLGPDEAPVPDGAYPARFSLWTDPTVGMGTEVWSENQDITTSGGLFSTYLGQVSSFFDVFAEYASTPLYLQVEVMVGGATRTLEPRVRLASVPYALDAGGVHSEATAGSARSRGIVRTKPGGSNPNSIMSLDMDGDGDGIPEYLVLDSVASNSASSRLVSDVDGDGAPDLVVGSVVDNSSARLSINTKGTGAKRLSAGGDCDDTDAVIHTDCDDDDDGIIESSVSHSSSSNNAALSLRASERRYTLMDAFPMRIDMDVTADPITKSSTISQTGDLDGDGEAETSMTSTIERKSGSIIYLDREGNEVIRSMVGVDSTRGVVSTDHDSDDDGISEYRAILTVTDEDGDQGSDMRCIADTDDDGLADNEVALSVTPLTSNVAIKTKGTGADKDRVISVSSGTADSTGGVVCDVDDDGDGIAEYRAVCTVTDADGDQGSDMRCVADTDDDGVAENEASFGVTPTSSAHAIKTKGTGAESNRVVTVSSGTDVSGASVVCDIDDDGDGVPESEISQLLTPTTSRVAIKTKGTGAVKNRSISSTCDDVTAVHSLDTDSDGDGLADRVVSSSVDDSACVVSAGEGDVQVSMRTRKGWDGLIYGNHRITNGSSRMIDLDSDGNGYFDNAIGVGMDPVHKIDVSGGAYCDGTNWVNASDINSKENFEQIDGAELLNKIAELEITKWNYKGDLNAQHIGPTAQDFQQTFGVGSDGKSISTIDPSGIALAAIKELARQLQEKDSEIDELKAELAGMKNLIQQANAVH